MASQSEATTPAYPAARIGWMAVLIFFLLYVLSFLDRQILNLLVGPIKASLGITDFQMSLLQGPSFALFYALFGLPIGWLVDRVSRRHVIFAGVMIWAAAASLSGLASRFWHLLIGRIAVGAGEAALAPAAYSLLSDLFPRERLAFPMSVMGAGSAGGAALSLFLGGILIAAMPSGFITVPILGTIASWQAVLLLTGLPGFLLAPLVFLVPDRRTRKSCSKLNTTSPQSLTPLFRRWKLYSGHFIGFGTVSLCGYAMGAWFPTFLIRVHGWDTGSAAYAAGLVQFAGVPGGMILGLFADRWFRKGRHDAHFRIFAICLLVMTALVTLAMQLSYMPAVIVLIFLQYMLGAFTGTAAAALQIATLPDLRGRVSAAYLLVFNLIGLGLGPVAVAFFTDYVFKDEMRVGASLAATFISFAPLGALMLLMAGRDMRGIMREAIQGGLEPEA
jgi:MFS family permease